MYQLTHNGQPVGKAHPHRITCYIEALERGLVKRGAGRHLLLGVEIVKLVPVLVPIIEPLDLNRRNVYEHPPANPHKGEFPRYLREPGASSPRTEIKYVLEQIEREILGGEHD